MTLEEQDRLASLHALGLLDTLPEVEYNAVVELASEICDTPISLVSLVDEDRQWFKASKGLAARSTHRNVSFCSHAIQQPEMFVVEDATRDARFEDNSLVTGEPGIRFYAGVPLQAPDGHAIGTLCVIDVIPRILTERQRHALAILANQVEARVALRAKQKMLEATIAENARLTASLQRSDDLFRAFMNHGPFISYIKDAEGRFVFYNQQLAKQFGVNADAWIGHTDADFFPEEMARAYREHDLKVLAGDRAIEFEEVTPGKEDEILHWHSYKFPFRQSDGQLMLAGISVDVTAELKRKAELQRSLEEKQQLSQSLEASHSLFHAFADLSPHMTFLKDEGGRYIFYNRLYADHFGVTQQEWIGKSSYDMLPPAVAARARKGDWAVLDTGEPADTEYQAEASDGRTVHFRSLKFTYQGADGRKMLAGIAIDITEQVLREQELKAANSRLDQLATTDALTDLHNRRSFETRIAIEFATSRRRKRSLSMLLIDVDNFKRRNDQLGHAAGDQALQLIGRVLAKSGRADDLPARLGGEEFAFLLPDTDAAGAMVIARRIQALLRQEPCGALPLTVSIGIASLDGTVQSWERLLACADSAMYEAKRSGKDCIVVHQDHVAKLMIGLAKPSPEQISLQTVLPSAAAQPARVPKGRPCSSAFAAGRIKRRRSRARG